LALGRLIVHNGGLPSTNALAWTEGAHHFYATSWLFDVACFGVTQALGLLGLQLLTLFLVCVALAGVTAACRAASTDGAWVPLATAWLLVPRITPRPHLASWAALALCLWLGIRAAQGRPRLRWICVPIIALASNLHAGAVFSAVTLGVFCIEAAV